MSEKSAKNSGKEIPGPAGSGETGTGPESPEAQEQRMALRKSPAPRLAERATALRGQGIGRPPAPKSVRRRRTQEDIYGTDPEIPYVKFEAATRDLICSLMERQDRMNKEIFLRINDLGYRLEALEEGRQENGGGR
jgi:hypothetical protein